MSSSLNIYTCNLHTHTVYCDGSNTVDEMVQAAIDAGLKTIGFSGHLFINLNPVQDWYMLENSRLQYCRDIKKAKEQYKDKINILLGYEKDYFSPVPEGEYDYSIGSVHFVCKDGEYIAMDLEPDKLFDAVKRLYGGDFIAMAKDYYRLVADVRRKTNGEIIGHFDLLTKFNEKYNFIDVNNREYRMAALEAADALVEDKDIVFEINTGAMSRGWRSVPYPADFIIKHIAAKKGRFIITGDSHSAKSIVYGYEDAIEYARACGIKELWTVEQGKEFIPVKI